VISVGYNDTQCGGVATATLERQQEESGAELGAEVAAASVVGDGSLAVNCQVGDGSAQRLLPRGRHDGAAVEGEGGECGEAAHCAQPLVCHVDAPAEAERREPSDKVVTES
jgi:hypothetical protein